ncbi:MAG: RAMP superfamily CRISPR-associated protein [Acidobacteriota bacterium]
MSRRIASRLKITGRLVACGPLHIGGANGNADVDLALAENGNGQLYVPGTSLAGPLRAWLLQQVDTNAGEARREWQKKIDGIWGFQEPGEAGGESKGIASFVIVEDGLVKLPAGAAIETRDGVGIDRVTGAAATHVKYNRAVLPAGSEIEFEMTVEIEERNSTARSHLIAALQALQRGEIRFGASKTRGLGKVTLKDRIVREQHLLSFGGMLNALRGNDEALDAKDLITQLLPGAPTLHVKIDWAPRGPLMVKAERDGVAVDMLPLVSAKGSDLTFVLPGSSIKGALRNQAERIVRTVSGISAPMQKNDRKNFMRQIEMRGARNESQGDVETPAQSLIGGLFGAAGKTEAKDKRIPEEGPPLLGLGALTVEDCYAEPRFSPGQWEAVESASDADDVQIRKESPLQQALQNAGLAQMQQAFHVAIDRWTGGAADGFLYTTLEPHGVAWEPMRLTLNLARLREEDHRPAVMCLLLTLRDLMNGRISIGFGTNRGMGAIKVTDVEITATNIEDELNDLNDVKIIDGKLGGWSERLKTCLESEWKKLSGGEER